MAIDSIGQDIDVRKNSHSINKLEMSYVATEQGGALLALRPAILRRLHRAFIDRSDPIRFNVFVSEQIQSAVTDVPRAGRNVRGNTFAHREGAKTAELRRVRLRSLREQLLVRRRRKLPGGAIPLVAKLAVAGGRFSDFKVCDGVITLQGQS